MDAFLKRWKEADRKKAVIEELEEQGVLFEPLADEVGKDFGPFDLICHVAYGQPPLTRRERAENVKKRNYFTKYGEKARLVLEGLLDKYADEGIENIEDIERPETATHQSVRPAAGDRQELRRQGQISGSATRPGIPALSVASNHQTEPEAEMRMSISTVVKTIQDIMRKDVGVDGDAQRIGQLVWMIFLKIFDDKEQEAELLSRTITNRPCRRNCDGATGPATPRA